MVVFEVFVNEERTCLAGVGAEGALMSSIVWRHGKVAESEHLTLLYLLVCGHSNDNEWVEWPRTTLSIGDEIRIRVAELDAHDTPTTRRRLPDVGGPFRVA